MWQDLKNIYHLFVAFFANVWFGWPSKSLKVIGVTGTDGKTTTVHLIYHILKTAGKKASMISSIGTVINGKDYELGFHVTTPSPFALQRFLKKANGFMVLEVTSHALDQYRVWGIDFSVGVLTNVTHEHLDYHKTYENYVRTKARLLKATKIAVFNADDDSYKLISRIMKHESRIRKIIYGIKNGDVTPKNFPFKTKLLGKFNEYNCLAAITACKSLGVSDSVIRKALARFKLPIGRAEIVHNDEFTVMIDFAHTPNALEQILSTVGPNVRNRLIHVFGSAGERDYKKRPEMGEISAKYCDVIILTAEDPRSESVEKIIAQIESGISLIHNSKFIIHKIPDRQEAISAAVKMAKRRDVVIITGKGHERSMNYGKGEQPWSEHKAVREALKGISA